MPPEGRNELERFVDKFGYNTIWTAITARLLDGSRDLIDDGCTNFKPEDMYLKFMRSLNVEGCFFTFDAVFEVYASFTDEYGEDHCRPQWFTVHCAAEAS